MKSLSTWILALSALSFIACDSLDDLVDGGTEVKGGMTGGMTGGMNGGMNGGMTGGMNGGMNGGMTTNGGVDSDECVGEPLEIGASCDPFLPCCGRSAECKSPNTDGSDPICLRKCDVNNPMGDGCAARELCIPNDRNIDPPMPSPGTCFFGDECEPGNENLACGEGEYSCQRIQNLSFCGPNLAEVPAAQVVGAGEACGETTACQAGLVCEYGLCRTLCDTAADCATEGAECANYTDRLDGIPYKFCLEQCDVNAQDCPVEGNSCFVADVNDGAIVGQCSEIASGTALAGEECTPPAQDADPENYWGSCTANSLCAKLTEDGNPECIPFCDAYSVETACGEHQGCAFVMSTEDLGLCFGECNTITQEGCDEGQDCIFLNEGTGTDGLPFALGMCETNETTERVATGDPCTGRPETTDAGMMYENAFVSNCPPNHFCGDSTNDMIDNSTCLTVCNPGNLEQLGCPEGFTCLAIFEQDYDITSYGICVQ